MLAYLLFLMLTILTLESCSVTAIKLTQQLDIIKRKSNASSQSFANVMNTSC